MTEQIDWDVVPCHLGGSHHYPISVNIDWTEAKSSKFVSKKKLMASLSEVEMGRTMTDITKVFSKEIENATTTLNDRSPKSWWHDDLNKHYRLYLAATKKCNKFPTPENFDKALSLKEIWKNEVKKAKNKNFVDSVQLLNSRPNTNEAWRFINNLKGNPKKSKNGVWSEEWNGPFLQHIKNQITNIQDKSDDDKTATENSFTKFKLEELNVVLKNQNKRSAGGHRIDYV